MINLYKFTINDRPVRMIYSSELSDDIELEQEQRYRKRNLVGTLKIIGTDYDWLDMQLFDTVFILKMFSSTDNINWTLSYEGKFSKTDCVWNKDDRSVLIKPTTRDGYDVILSILDKEVNMVDILPEIEKVKFMCRPILQVHVGGSTVITNITNEASWEEDITGESYSHSELIDDLHFLQSSTMYEAYTVGSSNPDVNGGYASKSEIEDAFSGDGLYYIRPISTIPLPMSIGPGIYRASDNVLLYYAFMSDTSGPWNIFYMIPVTGQATGTLTLYSKKSKVYSRIILNNTTFGAAPTALLPVIDIVPANRNYKRCIGYSVDTVIASSKTSVEPAEHGRNDYRMYFQPPNLTQRFFPIAKSTWSNVSYWFNLELLQPDFDTLGSKASILNDAYPLYSVIAKLLSYFNTGISFSNTKSHSEFLYSITNPLTALPNTHLIITPKTNVMVGSYDKAAQKAPITLKDIFEVLKNTRQLYWHIENNMLRIEHTFWYSNGGSYGGAPTVGIDLTQLEDPRSGQKVGYGQNKYSFEKSSIPERLQFNWMDKVSKVFEGKPIVVLNNYAAKNTSRNISVNKFITDFDYAIQNYKNLSSDGFILMSCIITNLFRINSTTNSFGVELDYLTGNVIPNPLCNITHWMPVEANKTYVVSHKLSVIFVDNFGAFISGSPASDTSNFIIPPQGTYLMKFTVLKTNWESFVVSEGTSKYTVPIITVPFEGTDHAIQNGHDCWPKLQELYYRYDAPAPILNINGAQVTAITVVRGKVQEVVFPKAEADLNQLIKTLVGNGFVYKYSLNLSSGMVKSTLKFETQ